MSASRLPHPDPISGASYSAAELMIGDATVVLLDQRRLPLVESYVALTTASEVAQAISTMVVRGAPAIGVAAAYAMVLAAGAARGAADFMGEMRRQGALVMAARPTAVNLAHAVSAMLGSAQQNATRDPLDRISSLAAAARDYHRADVAACRSIGAIGARRMPGDGVILTHCNAGALATGGFGTALGVIRAARAAGKRVRVVACETRPLLQGARLTAWELMKDGFEVTLVTDSMVAQLMRKGGVQACVVGADRVARNGDVANKIGTYGVACLARLHDIPFDVAAPMSTIDFACADGDGISIEQRRLDEVTHPSVGDARLAIAPDGVGVMNPSFDVTPARLVRAIYTEIGEVSPVGAESLGKLVADGVR